MKYIKHFIVLIACAASIAQVSATNLNREPDTLSLDDPKPRVVTGGFRAGASTYTMLLKNIPIEVTSSFHAGTFVGGFVDFRTSKHTCIQMELSGFYYNCNLNIEGSRNRFSNEGMSISLVFLGRWQIHRNGLKLFAGGGPYTEFVLGSQLRSDNGIVNPFNQVVGTTDDGQDVFALNSNYSGAYVTVGLLWRNGLELAVGSKVWSSDLLGYSHSDSYVRPCSFSASVGYHF